MIVRRVVKRPVEQVQACPFEDEVLVWFVLDTCVRATERAERALAQDWAELLDGLGEDAVTVPRSSARPSGRHRCGSRPSTSCSRR